MKPFRTIFFLCCFPLLFSCTPRPNLVMIITDDQGYGDLSLHGNSILETPHLDAIGMNGTRLDNFHVSPVCAPTRAAVLTGRRPMSTGAYYVTRGGEVMDDQEYTLAEVLRDNGYATGCFGKWHNGAHYPHHPLGQGFEEFFGFTAGHWNRYFDPELEHNGRMIPTRGYITDVLTDRAIDFIKMNRKEPFFCYLAYNAPHSPFQVPDRYYDMYIGRVEDGDSSLRVMNASVYGMVRNIDDNVGRLMGTLEQLGILENTLVVFLTDNGPNTVRYNGKMKGRKGWVNDGGIRVPCFLMWKGEIPAGKVVSSTTAHIDLLPTLVSLMKLDFTPVNEIHGMDLTGRILGPDREVDRTLFTHVNQGVELEPFPGAVRNSQWRMVRQAGGAMELTRRQDASESVDLADSFPEVAERLLQEYIRWFNPFLPYSIPPIPVGIVDSVVIPAHEGWLKGNAAYFWSDNGWANDWVHRLDMESSSISWPLKIDKKGGYACDILYTDREGKNRLMLKCGTAVLERELPGFIPVADPHYSRIDRPAEAIGQTWGRARMGNLQLDTGIIRLTIQASDPDLELLSVILTRQ